VAIQVGGIEGSLICCAYAPISDDKGITPASIRKALARLVPAYMLPHRWMRYEALPKNANGKIDRPRLKSGFLEEAQPHHATVPA
jgi:acyl-coenzyme A synthetase/AMP-(fatty) acid ligase